MAAADPPPWLFYLFVLRDELPLQSGWSVTLEDQPPAPTTDGWEGRHRISPALHAHIRQYPGQESGFTEAMRTLLNACDDVIASPAIASAADPALLDLPSMPRQTAVALVGAPAPNKDVSSSQSAHYETCFALLTDMVKALRLVTGAPIPNLSIERVWPLYLRLAGTKAGPTVTVGPTIVEHSFAGTGLATDDQLVQAVHLFTAGRRGDPVEIYRDFKLSANNAARVDGDYVEAVLKAAVAAEILIKHTAWLLTWEATTQLDADPTPGPIASLAGKPHELIGGVLSLRLHGNWNSRSHAHPVGGWRHHIARRRNAVIHRGYRPRESEMATLIEALNQLEMHILDRLSAKANIYPRTALMLAGRSGLESRSAWSAVAPIATPDARSAWMNQYLTWLETAVPETDPD